MSKVVSDCITRLNRLLRSEVQVFHPLIQNYAILLVYMVIKSRRLRWAGHVGRKEKGRSAFKILTSKHRGKRPFGKSIGIDGREYYNSPQRTRYQYEELGFRLGIVIIEESL